MIIKRRIRKVMGDSAASSDIAFLLIIYFIVIAGFNINKGFLLMLPAKDSQRLIPRNELFHFYLDSGGILSLRGEPCDRAGAEREIRQGMARYPTMAVLLTIDPEAPWQTVVDFVELAQGLEVDSFSFVMGEAPAEDP
jgi:biopolymer transport protein ExbD